jgi:hypothetical protein
VAIIGLWKWLTFGFVSITLRDGHAGFGTKGLRFYRGLLTCSPVRYHAGSYDIVNVLFSVIARRNHGD